MDRVPQGIEADDHLPTMKSMLCCAIVLVALMTRGEGKVDVRPGNIENWLELVKLGAFANHIDWFAKFDQRIFLVSKDDRVYVFGNQTSDHDLFGVNIPLGVNLAVPVEIPELRNMKIVKFATGYNHTLAMAADGTVWAWGGNAYGQLGVGTYVAHPTPVLMHNVNNAVDIVADMEASYVLTRDGHILACGFDHNTIYSTSAVRLNIEPAAGLHLTFYGTSVIITTNSRIYVWGEHAKAAPTLLPVPSKVVSVATDYHHYYILTEDGHILRSNSTDQLHVSVFYQGALKFKALYADQDFVLIGETIEGQLWMWRTSEGIIAAPVLLHTKDIVHAFAVANYDGTLPFMVKLNTGTSTLPPTTLSVTTTTSAHHESCGHLCQLMERMFNNRTASDTEFHLEGKTIYVDQKILVSASAYMARQFATVWKDKTSINITDYAYHLYYLYLRYLYTDRLDVTLDEAIDLNVLATNFHEEELVRRCHEIIKHHGF